MRQISLASMAVAVIQRELRLAFRRWDQVLLPLVFFIMVTALFARAGTPDPSFLRQAGPGVIWVAAILASLLSLESLFKPDVEDGTMEQWVLSGQPLPWLLLLKTVAHWLLTGVPLIVVSPLMATGFRIPNDSLPVMMASLTLGTAVLSLLGATGAALTVSIRRGNVLMALLVLPMQFPVLIFGAYAVNASMQQLSTAGPMNFLAGMLLLSLALSPFGMAAAIRISVEH